MSNFTTFMAFRALKLAFLSQMTKLTTAVARIVSFWHSRRTLWFVHLMYQKCPLHICSSTSILNIVEHYQVVYACVHMYSVYYYQHISTGSTQQL